MKAKALLALVLLVCAHQTSTAQSSVALVPVVTGLEAPVLVTHAGDGSGRLFVVEQRGRIRIVKSGDLLPTPFLDITARVEFGGEKGLLGLAFHPDFSVNRRFFVNYTTRVSGQLTTVVAEYLASSSNPDQAGTTERRILTFEQPFENHNGGHLAFGPDGFLYIGTGDGGSGGDPQGNAQNRGSLLGKILRIDVDSGNPYGIPPDNPFVGISSARPEIWAYGLRNPWRFSFDRLTGRLIVGDVGQNLWEEVSVIERGGDYGWNIMEGDHCYPPGSNCSSVGLIRPIFEYGHTEGTSITGGYVYRGAATDSPLWGSYVFGDFGSGKVWALKQTGPRVWQRTELLSAGFNISSFGEDEQGEIYLARYSGAVYRFAFPSQIVLAQAADGVTVGGRLRTSILMVNAGPQPAHVRVNTYGDDGQPLAVDWEGLGTSPVEITIPARSARSVRTTGASIPAASGWIDLETDGLLQASVLYGFGSAQGVEFTEAGVDRSRLGRTLITPVIREAGAGVDTAIALVNPSSDQDAQVTITVEDQNGNLVGQQVFTLERRGHRARFVQEIVSSVPADFTGTLIVTGSRDIAGVALRTKDGLPLSSIPIGN